MVTAVRSEMAVVMERVTPAVAQKWLARSSGNRHLREGVVAKYERDMAAGRWTVNNDAILIDENGKVVNGQHRLSALIRADVTLYLMVVHDYPADAVTNIDTGAGRSLQDVLALSGRTNIKQTAAVVTFVYGWDVSLQGQGAPFSAGKVSDRWPTRTDCLNLFDGDPEGFLWASEIGERFRSRTVLSAAVAGGLVYVFGRIDREAAELFMRDLLEGSNLRGDDPVYVLREWLLRERSGNSLRSVGVSKAPGVLARVVRAWNLRRSGKTITKFLYDPERQAFPRPK